ncbi:syntabulin isoform X1 [Cygnus atratus]|uniref:syntabulin isoform X1 n=1 Tax=Cygnus atratus TaxID=8868 RepID=UPI0015D60DC1|nr:syntabulin isoform X1 [Cygnus atratus]
MGPLRESGKEQKAQPEKEASRSRIPRLVLRPQYQQQHHHHQQKVSPASESPFSEEESREFNPPSSSGGSARTVSSNSFCSDDTGCPSSQSVSPVKTPSDAGHSPISFCTGSDGDFSRKKFNSGTMSEGNTQLTRCKKETKTSLVKPGSEADFSSSSSTGSISVPEVRMSAAGNKRFSFSRNRGPYGRNSGSSSYKSAASPPALREKDLLSTLCRNQQNPVSIQHLYGASPPSSNSGSNKGSDSSPIMRRSGRYLSCGENRSIKPLNPEQYLTPLQQKEVTVRHLKTKLKESESKLKERETEIEELKTQLERMREDWIEEECCRVEAQLALKEAKKEIKQLKQVIETMKNNLADKDKGIQKYFVDINVQNKKLESLLHSMEMAHSGSLSDEYVSDSPGKPLALYVKMPESLITEDQALEEMGNNEAVRSEDTEDTSNTSNESDSSKESLTTASSEVSDPSSSSSVVDRETHENVSDEKLSSSEKEEESSNMTAEQSIQTDVPRGLNVELFIQNIFISQDSPPSPPSSVKELSEFSCGTYTVDSGMVVDLTPNSPNSAILLPSVESPHRNVDCEVNENRVMKELDFTEPCDEELWYVNTCSQTGITKKHWNSSLLVDLLAVAAPVVPTVMWAFSTQRGGVDPMYNIGTLLRGCCLVALHSLRRTPFNIKT